MSPRMRKRVLRNLAALLLAASSAAGQAHMPPAKAPSQTIVIPAGKEKQAEMEATEAGAVHRELTKRAGVYSTRSRFIAQPGAQAEESAGTAVISMVLGGRFLLEEIVGGMMGQAFQGIRLWGYNSQSMQYETVWTYTLSTAMLMLAGTSSDAGKTVTYGAAVEDAKGAKQVLTVVTRQMDDEQFIVEMKRRAADGKEGASLVTTYTRKK